MANSNRRAEIADGPESPADRQARLGIALDHAWIGWMIADLRWHLARKYSAGQPRVPAGDPDGGQWVGDNGRRRNGEGASSPAARVVAVRPAPADDRSVISDADPVNTAIPGAQYAANLATDRYSVDLEKEEAANGGIGHTLRDHVRPSDEQLLDVVRKDRIFTDTPAYRVIDYREAQGGFRSQYDANSLVNDTLNEHPVTVALVASGARREATLNTRMGFDTGREAYRASGEAEPVIRTTYEVRVVIHHVPRSRSGFGICTAYPVNNR